ncbi:hypothetical protein ACCC98_05765 [Rhizobium pisi]|uniref:hypothetical protein n=1 Tax=Rhizobium pisi TaxID=574561 RepID=UPI0039AF435B
MTRLSRAPVRLLPQQLGRHRLYYGPVFADDELSLNLQQLEVSIDQAPVHGAMGGEQKSLHSETIIYAVPVVYAGRIKKPLGNLPGQPRRVRADRGLKLRSLGRRISAAR